MYLVMLVVSMLLPMRVSAQTVKGKLVDESNHPLPYANVVLLSRRIRQFVSGTISGEDGLFKLEATSVNQIVKISSIGYKTVYKTDYSCQYGYRAARIGCTDAWRSGSKSQFACDTHKE